MIRLARNTMIHSILVILPLCVCARGTGPADEVVLPRFEAPPQIDGDLSDAAWADAAVADGWSIPLTTREAPKRCSVRVGFDAAGLYVGADMGEPDPASLRTAAPDGGSGVWRDDCLEVWIRTGDNRRDFDQFIVNAAGSRQRVRGRAASHDTPAPTFPAGARIGTDSWSVELFIAYEQIGLAEAPAPGTMLQIKFGREDPAGGETTLMHWPPRAPYGAGEGYGRAYFVTSNLLPNADFSATSADGTPAGWTVHERAKASIAVVEDRGRVALRWDTPGSYATLQRTMRLEPRSLYRLAAWARGAAGIYLRARTKKALDQKHTDMYSVDTKPSGDYVYHSVTFPTGADGRALIILGNTAGLGAGPVYLSGLTVAREASVEAAGPAIPVTPGQTLWLTDIGVRDCRALRGFVGAPVDGRTDSVAWNGSTWEYGAQHAGAGVYYDFAGGDGLHVTLADQRGVDAVQIWGGAKVKLYRDATSYHEPGAGMLVWDWQTNTAAARALFGGRIMSHRFSFFDLEDGFISDLYFFRIGDQPDLPAPTLFSVVRTMPPPEELAEDLVQFGAQPGACCLLGEAAAAAPLSVGAKEWAHLLTDPVAAETGLLAVGLRVRIPDAPAGMPLTVALMDPFNPAMRVVAVELVVEAPGEQHVVLDPLDQVVPPGRRVWLALRTGSAVTLQAPQVELYYAPVEAARAEALAYRTWIVRTMFAALSEPRPWMSLRSRDEDLDAWAKKAYAGTKAVELLGEAAFAKKLGPDDDIVRQYDEWLWQRTGLPEFEPTIARVPGAPAWAVVLRQAWLEAREVPKWWLENRLVPTGELGGRVGDDSDMYQNYAMFPMISGDAVARLILQGAGALAEHAEATTLEAGLNKRTTDPLHAYEEGINHQALMAWWRYGDPVCFERCLAAARSMPALTVMTNKGHRHFKNQSLGAEDLRIDRELGVAGHAHTLMLHPVIEVLWYNRQPQVETFLREWADGWLEHQQPGAYAVSVDVATETPKQVYETRPLYAGYGAMASNFCAMIDYTGDTRYARPFMDMFARGRTSLRLDQFLPEFYQMGLLDSVKDEHLTALAAREPYLALLCRGDRAPLIQALMSDIAHLQRFKYMYTQAEQFTDRIFLSSIANAAKAYCGAYTTRNKFHHGFSVSWEGLGTHFAALVLTARATRLKAAVYSFADAPITGAMRVWRLEHGRYRVTVGSDTNRDDAADHHASTRELALRRGRRVPFTLPPGEVTIIDIRQIEAFEPIHGHPDLALSPLDTVIAAGAVRGVVHNIGQAGVDAATIALVDAQDRRVSERQLTNIPGIGETLEPVRLEYTLGGVPQDLSGWRVVVARTDAGPEIYEGNNSLDLERCGQPE